MKIAVLHNPTAGTRDISAKRLLRLLRRAGYRPQYFSTKEDAWKKPGAFRDAAFVVAAGGDGTIRRCGLQMRTEQRPMAPLPLGTANNICASLGIHGLPEEIIAGWAAPQRRRMDLGLARGPWGERHFIEGVGIGLIGRAITIMTEIAEASDHEFEERADMVHHGAAVMLALAYEVHPLRCRVGLGRARPVGNDYLLLEVLNIRRAGSGLELAPQADSSDGYFDVVSATATQRSRLTRHLSRSIGGSGGSGITTRRAREVSLLMSEGEFRLDDKVLFPRSEGELRYSKPRFRIDLSILPAAIEILLPAHAA